MKYIAFDLDETLLRGDKLVSTYTERVLSSLRARGYKTVVNTARSELFTAELKNLPECDYYIYNGGALIKNAAGETVSRRYISTEQLDLIIPELLDLGCEISVQTDEALLCNSEGIMRAEKRLFDFRSNKVTSPAPKILARIESDVLAEDIAKRHGLEMISYFSNKWRRYTARGVTKLSGLAELCEAEGGTLDDVMFFGDDHGDLDAIDSVRIGVLMCNAEDKHKISSRRITEYSCDEDGVARYLDDYFSLDIH